MGIGEVIKEPVLEKMKLHYDITEKIIGCSFEVMKELGEGFLEAVYKNSLAVALQHKGIDVKREVPFEISFRENRVGRYLADLLVENKVIVELKCCKILLPEHQAQVINYLKATGLSVGLLINFGNSHLECRRLHK